MSEVSHRQGLRSNNNGIFGRHPLSGSSKESHETITWWEILRSQDAGGCLCCGDLEYGGSSTAGAGRIG